MAPPLRLFYLDTDSQKLSSVSVSISPLVVNKKVRTLSLFISSLVLHCRSWLYVSKHTRLEVWWLSLHSNSPISPCVCFLCQGCRKNDISGAGWVHKSLQVCPVLFGAGGLPVRVLRRVDAILAEGERTLGRVEQHYKWPSISRRHRH